MGCASSHPDLDDRHPEQLQEHFQYEEWSHGYTGGGGAIPSMTASHPSNGTGHLHDVHVVPLSSTAFDIGMGTPNNKQFSDYGSPRGEFQGDKSMKQMLQVLESLDMGNGEPGAEHAGRASQASSILEDLRPGLERHFNQALGKNSLHGGLDSPARLLTGKENERPVLTSSPRGPLDSPLSSDAGSGSPRTFAKARKSKPNFVKKLLSRSSSSLGLRKRSGKGSSRLAKNGEADGSEDAASNSASQSAKELDEKLLFDSEFLDSYESALKEIKPEDWNTVKEGAATDMRQHDDHVQREEQDEETDTGIENGVDGQPQKLLPNAKLSLQPPKKNPLAKFEELCPPGGENTVVLYTTSLRGIRKTFEDCNNLRSALESFQVAVDERDVSMHQDFRVELKQMMDNKPVTVPRLFIKGRYIGGAEEVLQLHEDGQLGPLLEGLPQDHRGSGQPCDGCGGARFVPCLECSGSRKVVDPDNPKEVIRCPDCNENGLIQCPICC